MVGDRRRALLEAAAAEFARAGYEAASLNQILRASGFSKSSFYHYVDSKAELFTWTVDDLGSELARAADVPAPESFSGAGFWDAVERLVLRLAALAESDGRFADVGRMFYLPGAPRTDGAGLARAESAIAGWLSAALAVGRASGAVRTDLPASLQDALTLAVLRAFDEWALQHAAPASTNTASTNTASPNTASTDMAALARAQVAALRRLLAPDVGVG